MIKAIKTRIVEYVFQKSLESSAKELGLNELKNKLSKAGSDISQQYSSFTLDKAYMIEKVRNLHAFQISLVDSIMHEFQTPTIVDIGDSSGTHLEYLKYLYSSERDINCLSVNLDSVAVEKIRSKGLKAIHARAEDLSEYNIKTDIFLCYETLEHLLDPVSFLHNLADKTDAKYLVITVPYLKESRVGLYSIRNNDNKSFGAETTHIFELCPEDWKLIFRFSGWKIEYEQIYFQYPKKHYLSIAKKLWKKFDFEGFYGVVLVKDNEWSEKYLDW